MQGEPKQGRPAAGPSEGAEEGIGFAHGVILGCIHARYLSAGILFLLNIEAAGATERELQNKSETTRELIGKLGFPSRASTAQLQSGPQTNSQLCVHLNVNSNKVTKETRVTRETALNLPFKKKTCLCSVASGTYKTTDQAFQTSVIYGQLLAPSKAVGKSPLTLGL